VAVPKRRKSKSKVRMRRSHHSLSVPTLRPCPKCSSYTLPHRVCGECGYYKGELVIEKVVKISE